MIDEKKVSLMTRLTIYEKNENHGTLSMSKYYKTDYVRFNVLKSLVAASITYWILVVIYVGLHYDDLLANINEMDYFDAVTKLLMGYVICCLIYYAFSSVLYRKRYETAVPELTQYNSDLKDLIEIQGGPLHRARVVKNSAISGTTVGRPRVDSESARLKQNATARAASQRPVNPGVVRTNQEVRRRQVNEHVGRTAKANTNNSTREGRNR